MTDLNTRTLALREQLPALDWISSAFQLKRLSKDFHWFSPILKASLEDRQADLALRPRDEEQLRQAIAACCSGGIPITLRGGGTGNYGQAVPLQGGLVIDMSGLDQVCWLRDGIVRAQAGIRLSVLEDSAREQGWELRCMPSTFRIATLGGLFAGGFGGIGSITYGPLAANGTLLGARVMTVEPEPRIIELRAPELMLLNHAYGTNGIVLDLDIALAPAQSWDEYLLGFSSAAQAFACAQELAQSPGIAKRNIALFDAKVVDYFSGLTHCRAPGEHAVIAAVPSQARDPLEQLVNRHGGRIALMQSAAQVRESGHSLLEYCWNHTTLHALKEDKTLTYLQSGYEYGQTWSQLQTIRSLVGDDEVLTHLEFIRDLQGRIVCAGLPLVRYRDPQQLQALIELHRTHGITINDPHVFTLEDGKHSGALDPAVIELKRQLDPAGLLNPGKIRTWNTPV
ncbi:FAD-binding oxidoreductase [Pseudomonas sp. P1.8]|jgi:FAD/FMN-containing dehydrogenase|uniref:FAD-binding oxidoreductase n=1 Tax=Pseudomonas sp. P1.8 TaxID=1699310 RepID=UPI00069D569F|nr:FAD-binding oxidoreductase [Pseudomonas sp. P1.8]